MTTGLVVLAMALGAVDALPRAVRAPRHKHGQAFAVPFHTTMPAATATFHVATLGRRAMGP